VFYSSAAGKRRCCRLCRGEVVKAARKVESINYLPAAVH
jgi:hypothetical protein